MVFAIFAGTIGGALSIAMRLELQEPGLQYFGSHTYNVLMSAHGIIMIFFTIMPALIGGFGNWFVPLLIGAPDMAFPRLNNLSFWLLVAAFGLFGISMFLESEPNMFGPSGRLDAVSTAFHDRSAGPGHRFHHRGAARRGSRVHSRCDQYDHHHFQHAGARHDVS